MELFNEHYINIVEKFSGKKPLSLGNFLNASQDEMTVEAIIFVYNNHPSIRKIKNLCVPENKFDLPYASTRTSIKYLDGIFAKNLKMSASY